jgi:streptogramin lyase
MKVDFRICFIFTLALFIAACGLQGTPTPAPEVAAAPLSTVSMNDRLLASIDTNAHPLSTSIMYGNHPEEIVFANGFIWIHLVNGHMVQVDPLTNTIVSAVKTDTTNDPHHYCQGLGTDGKDIWVCSAAGDEDHKTINVVRVDTLTQVVVATFEVGKIWDQLYMPFVQNQIWALTGDGSKLVGIDVSNNQANPAIDLGVHCFHLAALDDMLIATCGSENLVIKIDPGKKEVVARQTVQFPLFIFTGKDGVWVSQTNSITRLDPESLKPIVTITGITGSDINVTETAVWVWEYEKGILYKIDPSTNEVAELIKPDEPFISGGGVLLAADSLWLTVDENDLLLRLSLK